MKRILTLCLLLTFQFVGSPTPAVAQLIIAHRGASADAPENTVAAFQLAWEQGADAIEGDFYLTSDRQIVCFHDGTTKRLCGVELPVAKSTLAELQALDVGSWKDQRFAKQRMPSLSEVLALVPSNKSIFIEIKSGPEIVPFLPRILEESAVPSERTIIISFHKEVIRAAKERMANRKAYWLTGFHQDEKTKKWTPTVDEVIATAKEIHADGVDLNANTEVVNTLFVERCHQAGLSVHVWTVDDLAKANRLQKMGVDSITTNLPGLFSRNMKRQKNPLPQTTVDNPAPDALEPALQEAVAE